MDYFISGLIFLLGIIIVCIFFMVAIGSDEILVDYRHAYEKKTLAYPNWRYHELKEEFEDE